jgi:hypothetical protein
MSIQTLASDLAARIPEMAHDNTINNSNVIQGMIEAEMRELNDTLLSERNKVAALRITMRWMVDHTGGYERQLAKETLEETK